MEITKPTTPSQSVEPSQTFWRFFSELGKTLISVFLIAYLVRVFVLQPFIVEGSSMAPRFATNDYLLVDKISYRFQAPARGDIVVFEYPNDVSLNYVKRMIGLPGETVKISDGQVYIINQAHPDGLKLDESYLPQGLLTTSPGGVSSVTITVPTDQYFVLGDNRPHSSDSREWGLLPKKDLIGRVIIQAYPFNKISTISHVSYPAT